jgi:hypothetical protein
MQRSSVKGTLTAWNFLKRNTACPHKYKKYDLTRTLACLAGNEGIFFIYQYTTCYCDGQNSGEGKTATCVVCRSFGVTTFAFVFSYFLHG